jgi:hypothetical protein
VEPWDRLGIMSLTIQYDRDGYHVSVSPPYTPDNHEVTLKDTYGGPGTPESLGMPCTRPTLCGLRSMMSKS